MTLTLSRSKSRKNWVYIYFSSS